MRDYFAMGPLDVFRQAAHALDHRIGEWLPRVRQPAVVVRGAHDFICTERWAREATALLPDGSLVTLAGASHAPHFSHPREVADVVRRLRGTLAAAG